MAGRFAIQTTIRAVDKVTRPVRRMTRTLMRFTAAIGRMFTGLTKKVGKFARALTKAGGQFAKFSAVGGAALFTGVVLLNKATVEAQMLSKAVGVSIETVEGLAAAVAPAGFNLENVVSLVEEMNNKFGESAGLAQTLPVQESMALLGLRFRDLKKLRPEEQFLRIGNAILSLKDDAKAVSAADILFGGEANRVFGVLRATGGSMEDIIDRFKEFNFQTEESREGAARFNKQWARILALVTTLGKFIAGMVGDAMEPLLDSLTMWVVQNKELIQSRVIGFITSFVTNVRAASQGLREFISSPKVQANLEQLITGGQVLLDIFKEYGPTMGSVGRMVLGALGGIAKVFDVVGTAIGVSVGFIVTNVTKLVDFVSESLRSIQGFLGFGEGAGAEDGGNAGARAGGAAGAAAFGAISSPQARTASLLEEKKVTNTTTVTLEDQTGRVRQTGKRAPGFSLINSGAF